VRAWRDLPGLRDPDRFDAWLHRLLVNSCLDEARRRRRRPIEVEIDPIHEPQTGIDDVRSVADRDQVERALNRLDPEHRALVVLHYYLGYPLPEAAASLGISLPAAKSRLHRAMDGLRRTLAADPVAPADLEGGRPACRRSTASPRSPAESPRRGTRSPRPVAPRISTRSSPRPPAPASGPAGASPGAGS